MPKETPPNITALSRIKHHKWNKKKKADLHVISLQNFGFSEKTKCQDCGILCYYSHENEDLKKKKFKKVCPYCAISTYRSHLNSEQIEILERVITNLK